MMMRLNKYIAHHSSYSRREADKVIQDGYVRVNGEIQDNPATQIDEKEAIVYVSGKQVTPRDKYTVIVYNKPKGELVTKTDPRGRKTIYDTLDKQYKHYIPIGRLDYATEGVLLLTDASKVATALMNSGLERIYKVKIKGEITQVMEDAMLNGLELTDASAGGHTHSKITSMTFAPFIGYKIQKSEHNYSVLKIAIAEGQNREIRRFFAHFGTEVADLKRVSFAEVELNNLPTGKARFLTRSEYAALFTFMKGDEKKQREIGKTQKDPRRTAKSDDNKPKESYISQKDTNKTTRNDTPRPKGLNIPGLDSRNKTKAKPKKDSRRK